MAQFPRCPHCNVILPDFASYEKKICPNCDKRVHNYKASEKAAPFLPVLFKASWLWLLTVAVSVLFAYFEKGSQSAAITLWVEGLFIYLLTGFSRNRLLRKHLQQGIPLSDARQRELTIRKRQMGYYGKAAASYAAISFFLFLVLGFATWDLPQRLPDKFDLLIAPMLLFASMAVYNLICLALRFITMPVKLPSDNECRHRTVSEPFQ